MSQSDGREQSFEQDIDTIEDIIADIAKCGVAIERRLGASPHYTDAQSLLNKATVQLQMKISAFQNGIRDRDAEAAIPRYKSHKIVGAMEISDIRPVPGAHYEFKYKETGEKVTSYSASDKLFSRYTPVVGDFLVFYPNDYQSFSPRKEFLDGYSAIESK
jgi:hypothetical protein